MRIDRFSLRGWILLGLAMVAALSWLAALSGLGRQISARADVVAAHPPLPTLGPLADDPMTVPASHAAISERPVFAEDRRPHPFRLGGPAASNTGSLRLTGVLLAGDFGMATLTSEQNRSLRLRLDGDAVEGWQLLALEPRRATVLGPEGAQVLELSVFDGQGGEPPTQLRDPRSGNGAAPPVLPPPPVPRPAQPARGAAAETTAPPVPAQGVPAASEQPSSQGPSEEQMRAIRERIRARREQLQQQQQQRQPTPPPGGGANP